MIKIQNTKKGELFQNGRMAINDKTCVAILINHIDVFRGTKQVKYCEVWKKIYFEDIVDGSIHKTIPFDSKCHGSLRFNLFDKNNNAISYKIDSIESRSSIINIPCKKLINPNQKVYKLSINFHHTSIEDVVGLYMFIQVDSVFASRRNEHHVKCSNEPKSKERIDTLPYNMVYTDLNGILDINETDYFVEYDLNKNTEKVDLSILEDLSGLFV